MIEMNDADALSREMQTAQIARVAQRGSMILKIVSGVLAASAIVASWISATTDQNVFYGSPKVDFPLKWKVQSFLSSAIVGVAWAALILAAAFALEIVALRAARLPHPAAELSEFTATTPEPAAAPSNFAARPAQAAAVPAAPPPMKIANDEIWRR